LKTATRISRPDRASIDASIEPFANFIAQRVQWSMEQAAAKVAP
jgi:hypothetical protein